MMFSCATYSYFASIFSQENLGVSVFFLNTHTHTHTIPYDFPPTLLKGTKELKIIALRNTSPSFSTKKTEEYFLYPRVEARMQPQRINPYNFPLYNIIYNAL